MKIRFTVTAKIIFSVLTSAEFNDLASGQNLTDIQVTPTVLQSGVTRLGVNLGDQTYWDSGQMMKNLIFGNPGFEGLKYRSILKCAEVTESSCTDDNDYSPQPTGFWEGGTYLILSGKSSGMAGKVVKSTKNPNVCSGCGQIVQFDKAVKAAVGDYFVVTNYFPGNGDSGWWDNTSGGGTIETEMNDLSPNAVGKQAVVLDASKHGAVAGVTQYFDSTQGLSFIQLNGKFALSFRAKGTGGNNTLAVMVRRLQTGRDAYLGETLKLSKKWQDFELSFSANEDGSALGTVQVSFQVNGASAELDDVSLVQTDSDPKNYSVFRDDVVNALNELHPGVLRMMASGAALGSDVENQLQPVYARYRGGFSTGSANQTGIAYGIPEFLTLCSIVGADPWITIPTATTPQEMRSLMNYLIGDGSDSYSALRISQGHPTPFTSSFKQIHIELGNETWNGSFKGESMAYPAYPQWANQVFGAARQTPGYMSSKFDLVLDGWAAVPAYNSSLLGYSTEHDSIDIAPYLLYSANNEAMSKMFGALFAEPEVFNSPGGKVYQTVQIAAQAPVPTKVSVYEANLGTEIGNLTQEQLFQLTPSLGAGIAHTEHMLQMMRLGIKIQNAFALQQFEYKRNDGSLAKLWGMVVDMGTTNRRRPQFLTQELANSVIGGNMLQTAHTGADPTWNQPKSSDGVQLDGAHLLQSFAFFNGNRTATIIFNLSEKDTLPVTFSGLYASTGSVQMSQIASGSIIDNNETSNEIGIAKRTLTNFNPSSPLALPPFSMTVLESSNNPTPPPTFATRAGTYSRPQNVVIEDTVSGAVIYFTVDGSNPSVASTVYTGPVLVSKTETVKAFAVAVGQTPSTISSAGYVIARPSAAAPKFSVAGGTYKGPQKIAIKGSNRGAAIYYTLDGSDPTTSSKRYNRTIAVTTNETIKAFAVTAGLQPSPIVVASYVIDSSASTRLATPVFLAPAGIYPSP